MSKPFKHFDITKQHLPDEGHFTTPKTRDPNEREELHYLPAGTTLNRHIARGMKVVAFTIAQLQPGSPGLAFVRLPVSASLLNEHWYKEARDAEQMRKRDYLQQARRTAEERYTETVHVLATAAEHAGITAVSHEARQPRAKHDKKRLGQIAGYAGLCLSTAQLGDLSDVSEWTAQAMARQEGLEVFQAARTLGGEIGSHPSVAQFGTQYSDMAQYIYKNAPTDAFRAYSNALDAAGVTH